MPRQLLNNPTLHPFSLHPWTKHVFAFLCLQYLFQPSSSPGWTIVHKCSSWSWRGTNITFFAPNFLDQTLVETLMRSLTYIRATAISLSLMQHGLPDSLTSVVSAQRSASSTFLLSLIHIGPPIVLAASALLALEIQYKWAATRHGHVLHTEGYDTARCLLAQNLLTHGMTRNIWSMTQTWHQDPIPRFLAQHRLLSMAWHVKP